MYYYNINRNLVTAFKPIEGLTQVSLTEEQIENCIGFDANGKPILKTIYLSDEKIRYKELVKKKEAETINNGFTFKSLVFDCDEKAQGFISALLTAVNSDLITEIKGFTTKENIDVDLNAQDIKDLAICCLGHVSTAHKSKRDLYKQIDACKNLIELQAIVI